MSIATLRTRQAGFSVQWAASGVRSSPRFAGKFGDDTIDESSGQDLGSGSGDAGATVDVEVAAAQAADPGNASGIDWGSLASQALKTGQTVEALVQQYTATQQAAAAAGDPAAATRAAAAANAAKAASSGPSTGMLLGGAALLAGLLYLANK